MSHFLVLTAIGADRTGIVSELTKLVSECGCNINDSRMAIFGNEFTLIMLLSGNLPAITNLENKLPPVAHALELITMMKRTTNHKEKAFTKHFEIEYSGEDAPGVLNAVTNFLADRKIDISSLKTEADSVNNKMTSNLLISITDENCDESLSSAFLALCEDIGMQGTIKQVEQATLF